MLPAASLPVEVCWSIPKRGPTTTVLTALEWPSPLSSSSCLPSSSITFVRALWSGPVRASPRPAAGLCTPAPRISTPTHTGWSRCCGSWRCCCCRPRTFCHTFVSHDTLCRRPVWADSAKNDPLSRDYSQQKRARRMKPYFFFPSLCFPNVGEDLPPN